MRASRRACTLYVDTVYVCSLLHSHTALSNIGWVSVAIKATEQTMNECHVAVRDLGSSICRQNNYSELSENIS